MKPTNIYTPGPDSHELYVEAMESLDQKQRAEQVNDIPEARYHALMANDDLQLTPAELKAGWHFCYDWDGLLIGPGMNEIENCTCWTEPGSIDCPKHTP